MAGFLGPLQFRDVLKLSCAENLRVTNAGQARDGIVQIDVGIIGQKLGVPGALGEYRPISIRGAVVDFCTVTP